MSLKNNPTSKYLGIKMNKGWNWFNVIVDVLMFWGILKQGGQHHTVAGSWIIWIIAFLIWLAIHYGVVRLIVFAYNKLSKNQPKQEVKKN
tara:strand:+ start:126 stop:395 length:270 start_codon:yes stop_codon:yes gene_type:complete